MAIYAITSGKYSDYEVHGYCTTEEKAKQLCAEWNRGDYEWAGVYWCEELKCLDERVSEKTKASYKYGFSITRNSKTKECKIGEGKFCYISEWKEPQFFPKECIPRSADSYDYRWTCFVYARENNSELARKIALDAFYEKIATEENIV